MEQKHLITSELGEFIETIFAKLKTAAEEDSIYEPLDVYFANGTPNNIEGNYCYSNEYGYHYCFTERGVVTMHKTTQDLFEISFWVIKGQIFSMALEYELKNRIKGQDPRRLLFKKELQLFDLIGEDYRKQAEIDIHEILKTHPYRDELFQV